MRRGIGIVIFTAIAILAATGVATAQVTIGQDKNLSLKLVGGTAERPIMGYTIKTADRTTYGKWEFDCTTQQYRNLARGPTEAMTEAGLPESNMHAPETGTSAWMGMLLACAEQAPSWGD
jgi:hypothetical protein